MVQEALGLRYLALEVACVELDVPHGVLYVAQVADGELRPAEQREPAIN